MNSFSELEKRINQIEKNGKTTVTFQVKHLYQGKEQETLTEIFHRMYGWS